MADYYLSPDKYPSGAIFQGVWLGYLSSHDFVIFKLVKVLDQGQLMTSMYWSDYKVTGHKLWQFKVT